MTLRRFWTDMTTKDFAAAVDPERTVAVSSLQVGDRFVVRPGEKVATDGTVVSGSSAIDASLVTGESVPVEVGPGDAVVGVDDVVARLELQERVHRAPRAHGAGAPARSRPSEPRTRVR